MFHFRHKPRGLNKSVLITVIAVIENYASAMMTLILPLYLYAFFQSELAVGQISTLSSFAGIITTLLLGFLLTRFSRTILYKIGIILSIASIFIFFILSHILDAHIARSLFCIAGILTPAVLSLYLRDLTTPDDLPHMQGVFSASVNIAWLTGPMISGGLISFFTIYQDSLTSLFPVLQHLVPEYFQYTMPFIIAIFLYLFALSLFAWNKFVVKHPHLQETEKSKKLDEIHHHKHFSNIREHFQNTKRTLSFINLSFIAIWWVFIFTYLSLLLEQHHVSPAMIGILVGLVSLPNALFESFVGKVVKICKGSTNALIYGYIFFFSVVLLAFIVGYKNIYLFTGLIIFSQIGVAVTEPLQELQYFEGTTEENEGKFYTIHRFGNQFFSLITPVIVGWAILQWGIHITFYSIPFLFIPLFILLFYYRKKEELKEELYV